MSDGEDDGRITVWRCIGCGRIEAPAPCIGVCENRELSLVETAVYEDALVQIARLREHARVLSALVQQLAHTTPRNFEWARCGQALQRQVRDASAALESSYSPSLASS